MTETPAQTVQSRPVHWPSVFAVVGGMLSILIFAAVAAMFFISGLISTTGMETAASEPVMLFSYAVTGALIGMLLLPVVLIAVQRLSGQPAASGPFFRSVFGFRSAKWMLPLYPVLLVAGYFLNTTEGLDLVLLPVINVLVLSLPVAWLVWLGTRDLPQMALQRNWSVFGFSMTVSPLVIIILELLLFFLGLVFISFLAIAFFPAAVDWFEELVGMFEAAATSMELPEQALIDLVQSPAVVAIALLFTAGVVPLIEEAIKPLAVWLVGGRRLTPTDGWVLGLLSGAGFALVENLGNLAVGEGWAFLMLARAGAAGLHMFNSAIIGYTFVLSRQRKQWRPFILAFLGTVGFHALWNAVAVMATLQSITDPADNNIGWPLGYLAILAAASLATYTAIGVVNKRLAETNTKEHVESEINSND